MLVTFQSNILHNLVIFLLCRNHKDYNTQVWSKVTKIIGGVCQKLVQKSLHQQGADSIVLKVDGKKQIFVSIN